VKRDDARQDYLKKIPVVHMKVGSVGGCDTARARLTAQSSQMEHREKPDDTFDGIM
jgi:hypothetical protein